VFVPARRATPEWLDDPATDRATAIASGEDIARCNRWLGGRAALRRQLAPLWARLPRTCTVLDLASGVGDLGAALRAEGARHGVSVTVIALDRRPELLARAAGRGALPCCADATALPLGPASVDVVVCGQFLHHLTAPAIVALLRQLGAVARCAVVLGDLRRSWLAAAGLWCLSWPLRLHAISRHDGTASVLKGFTAPELSALLHEALGHPVPVRRRAPFRLTAAWGPALLRP
jgi:2-polyprenyl-3-methyl-5-hydroxy-6-metoxy-1,4-benzoquinol methylase